MPKISAAITFPEGWTDRERRMLRLLAQVAGDAKVTRAKLSMTAQLVTALAVSMNRHGIPLVSHGDGVPFDARVAIEQSAATQEAADLVMAEFPGVAVRLDLE